MERPAEEPAPSPVPVQVRDRLNRVRDRLVMLERVDMETLEGPAVRGFGRELRELASEVAELRDYRE